MIDAALVAAILDSLKDRIVYVSTNHIICYMNKTAILHYEEGAN